MSDKAAHIPRGFDRFKWFGPAFIWMVSSVGSGEILFTPRLGSRYHYDFIWAAIVLTYFIWVMIREIGRYTVVTGESILEGYDKLFAGSHLAVWIIALPQVLAAVVTISGIGALLGSMLMIVVPGDQRIYTPVVILLSAALIATGKYKRLEKLSVVFAAVLMVSAVIAALTVLPPAQDIAAGLVPRLPADFDLYFVLPWFGFYLAGAAGLMWFSYWIQAQGYGSGARGSTSACREWMKLLSTTATIAVGGGSLIIIAFLILGRELLSPQGIMPEGIRVAEDLTRLLSEVWGVFGYWLMVVTFVVALWGTVLSNQDGWPRLFVDATFILGRQQRWSREHWYLFYLAVAGTVLPLAVFFIVRDPVKILSAAGIVAASHIPFVAALTLLINIRYLPKELRPGKIIISSMALAILFYFSFAVVYFLNLFGLKVI